ncbi:L-histidine N(alpha)-methyltransferase [Sphingomonas sp.]|uniref:L-histidine N(alpha)-methyltransferase n=1 Tax=Sphingomonas sp. TaxID=28214 RepID=UPI00185CE3B4|nr:L-histidine N(alpha)-methyltransferase [Sphingomonas sp.]MBA4763575.1 L-histidine N(alpha)-methyltransferase [Sphingomonas sp.]
MLKQEIEDGQAGLADPAFRADVLNGLAARPRAIPARWFYDRRGSELFEDITRLPEYYPTRTETALLERVCPEVARETGTGGAVIEFGSGSSVKTPVLLRALRPAAYVPIDISGDFLRDSARTIAAQFPGLAVEPVEGDFLKPLKLPAGIGGLTRLGFFPGSTIGNMAPVAAVDLLRTMRASLGEGSSLLIGIDRIKDPEVLVPAYDDAAGVTAAFNLNLLERINAELSGTIPVDAFAHVARWNDARARIEMHLEATRAVAFEVDGRGFAMAAGETIHTENSHKYGDRDARLLLAAGGWTVTHAWSDEAGLFGLYLAEARAVETAP